MKLLRKIVRKILKAAVNLEYRLNPDRDVIIAISLGTKCDDHDFTLFVNRYPA